MAVEDLVVRREVVLPVDRETAWTAIQDAEGLATWLADEVALEIEMGAEGWLRWEDGESRRVVVQEVEQRRRVVLRWSECEGPETVVELVLDDVPGGTRLVVLELPVAQLRAVGVLLDQGPCFFDGPGLGAPRGPQMVAALA